MSSPPPLPERLRRLVLEAHRRSLWQVLGLYVVVSWLGYEVVLALTEGLGLPAWVPPFALVLFIIGLPVVLATAFVHEGMPGQATPANPPPPAGPAAAPDVRTVPTRADDEERLPPGAHRAPAGPVTERAGAEARVLTWRRVGMAGVLAFAALGLAATGFMGMRTLGIGPVGTLVAKGELEARDPLVVADFEPLSGDTSLALVVAEGLRADLAQSSFVTVADRAQIRETLDRMLRPADARLDPITAREVALRMGLKAVVEGEVGRAGAGYLLTARVVTADSARTLASFRETASDSTELLPAIERMARALRERVGESLRTVRASPPLAQVTTPSLPALRKAAEGRQAEAAGNRSRAARLLTDAVQLDPGFAWAWHNLAVLHYNDNRREPTLRAIERALEHEDRLDEIRRHRARAFFASITGDHPTALLEEQEVVALDPSDPVAHISLSDITWNQGDWAAAEDHARRAIELQPDSWVAHWNLLVALLDAGKVAEARRAVEAAAAALPPGHGVVGQLRDETLATEGHWDSIRALPDVPLARKALAERTLGRWNEADVHLREAGVDGQGQAPFWEAWNRLVVLGEPEAADWFENALETRIAGNAAFPEHAIAEIAVALAMVGRADAARRARALYEERVPERVRWSDSYLLHSVDAFNALGQDRPDDAIAAFRTARESTTWPAPVDAFLGRAYDVLGRPDSAIAAYSRYIETPWAYRVGFFHGLADPALLVPSHERLAYLYEEAGDRDAAARHAAAVLRLWGNADAVLQDRVAAMRRLLERVGAEAQ
jgi:tetratricopeptide (TPR) repeat protein